MLFYVLKTAQVKFYKCCIETFNSTTKSLCFLLSTKTFKYFFLSYISQIRDKIMLDTMKCFAQTFLFVLISMYFIPTEFFSCTSNILRPNV